MTTAQLWTLILELFGTGCLLKVISVAVSVRDSVRDLVLKIDLLHATTADHEERLRQLESGRRHYGRQAVDDAHL